MTRMTSWTRGTLLAKRRAMEKRKEVEGSNVKKDVYKRKQVPEGLQWSR